MVHLSPSLTLHLVTLKVSPLKGEKTILGHSSTTMQTFMPFGVIVAEISRDIEKNTDTRDLFVVGQKQSHIWNPQSQFPSTLNNFYRLL